MARVLCLLALIATVSAQDIDWTSNNCGMSKYPDAGQDGELKIINGWTARQGEFPWQAAILYLGFHNCGAVVISNYWVITAAHCLDGLQPSSNTIVVGQYSRESQDGTNHAIDYFTIHEAYNEQGEIENDIAVVRLQEPITMSEDVTPACRPSGPYDRTYGTTSGWGRTETGTTPDLLLYANEFIVDQDTCVGCYNPGWILPGMLCYGSCDGSHDQSTCSGDSGGPLVVNNNGTFDVVGLTSWGLSGNCLQDTPPVFTNVSYFNQWVDEHADPINM